MLLKVKHMAWLCYRQESPANAKRNAWRQCMFEGLLWTKSKLTDSSNWHWVRCIYIYARWHHCLAWLLPFEWLNASILTGVPLFGALVCWLLWT